MKKCRALFYLFVQLYNDGTQTRILCKIQRMCNLMNVAFNNFDYLFGMLLVFFCQHGKHTDEWLAVHGQIAQRRLELLSFWTRHCSEELHCRLLEKTLLT